MTQPKIEGVGHGIPRMLYASDGSDWYAILVDSDGHVKIDVVSAPGSNALGNFPFGYYDRYSEQVTNLEASAGWNDVVGTAVPVGEIWVIQALAGANLSRIGIVQLGIRAGAVDAYAISATMGAASQWVAVGGSWVMKAADTILCSFGGCQAGDDLYLRALGYKMKVA